MKHLLSYSVFQPPEDLHLKGKGLKEIGCDGVELFTLFEKVPQKYKSISPSVHLPYGIDWYSGWIGTSHPEFFDEENVKHIHFGRDREEMIRNITSAIKFAAEIKPAYGVFHANNTNLNEATLRVQTDDSRDVLRAFCEMMNQTISGFKKGEPPFKLAFENLWGPGLRLREPWEYQFLTSHLEFDNWGLCLDTGHLMNTLPDAYDEETCVNRLLKIFDTYPGEMKERVGTVHLHLSTSAEYRNTFEPTAKPPGETVEEMFSRVYPHIMKLDQHRPFSAGGCKLLINELSPDFVTHEMIGMSTEESLCNFVKQRAHFPKFDESYK